MRHRFETPFAVYTLIVALPYFIGETYHYLVYVGLGNGLLNYAVDLIAISLMMLGSVASLTCRPVSASGWLAAAWGFVACLNYRAFSWRYEEVAAGGLIDTEPSAVLTILSVTLVTNFLALFIALYLARPRKAV